MLKAVEHLTSHHIAALFLDPGLRKTSITLEAFCRLKESGAAKRMLVVAPMRVCRNQWRQEAAKWEQFRHLRFAFLHGPKKAELLATDADIYLINPEGVEWLAKRYPGRRLPFDVVCFDELTKFKNSQAKRHKALRPRLAGIPYRWGLTGTPVPNGYMDLFGQMLILDDGAALGRYITHFRDNYFQLDFNGFDYQLMPGGAKRIEAKVAPYVLQMSADDYIYIPPVIPDPIELDWTPEARTLYQQMKTKMVAQLPDHTVTAANAAGVYAKLSQMANGAVYLDDTGKNVAVIHDIKLEALEDLLDSLNGQQLLIAYEFEHDRERLRQWFNKPGKKERIHFIGSGIGEKQEAATILAWNRAQIQMMACHPASTGHGLNLQESQCMHVCWFSPIWDLELWDQFIRRVRRSGNMAAHVIVHMLIMKQSLDGIKLETIEVKDVSQKRLLKALKSEILRDDADNPTAGTVAASKGEDHMIQRLSQPGQGAQQPVAQTGAAPRGWGGQAPTGQTAPAPQPQPAPQQTTAAPKGWGQGAQQQQTAAPPPPPPPQQQTGAAPRGWGQTAQPSPEEQAQRERINSAITTGEVPDAGESASQGEAMAAFSAGVQQQMQTGAEPELPMGQEPPPPATQAAPKRTRKSSKKDEPAPVTEAQPDAALPPWHDSAIDAALVTAKADILKIVFADPATTLEEGLELAGLLYEWVKTA